MANIFDVSLVIDGTAPMLDALESDVRVGGVVHFTAGVNIPPELPANPPECLMQCYLWAATGGRYRPVKVDTFSPKLYDARFVKAQLRDAHPELATVEPNDPDAIAAALSPTSRDECDRWISLYERFGAVSDTGFLRQQLDLDYVEVVDAEDPEDTPIEWRFDVRGFVPLKTIEALSRHYPHLNFYGGWSDAATWRYGQFRFDAGAGVREIRHIDANSAATSRAAYEDCLGTPWPFGNDL